MAHMSHEDGHVPEVAASGRLPHETMSNGVTRRARSIQPAASGRLAPGIRIVSAKANPVLPSRSAASARS